MTILICVGILLLTLLSLHLYLCTLFVHVSFEFYQLLSHNFQAKEVVNEKMKKRMGIRTRNLFNSFSWKLYSCVRGWNKRKREDVFLNTLIMILYENKMADIAVVPFSNEEELKSHPYLHGLSLDDYAKYQKQKDKLLNSGALNISKHAKTEDDELANDLRELSEAIAQNAVQIQCVRKLLSKGRPKRQSFKFVTSLSL